jgi:Rps23 Pro-64 3,4-dihydroxylase Tpa1-like proline 4-hydroxylase
MAFALHPAIRMDELREAFDCNGWVQIAPFIDPASAEALRDDLVRRDDWRVSFRVGTKPQVQLTRQAWDALSTIEREGIRKLAAPAEEGFRYLYEEIHIADSPKPAELAGELDDFARFMSSGTVIELARHITGCCEISTADARATSYGPGHFLTIHDDDVAETHRRAAYVFGLTPSWRPEWGGLLLFHGESGDVQHGLAPRMNALNLFAIPKRHSVSLVAPFAPAPRLAITGWFHAPPRG